MKRVSRMWENANFNWNMDLGQIACFTWTTLLCYISNFPSPKLEPEMFLYWHCAVHFPITNYSLGGCLKSGWIVLKSTVDVWDEGFLDKVFNLASFVWDNPPKPWAKVHSTPTGIHSCLGLRKPNHDHKQSHLSQLLVLFSQNPNLYLWYFVAFLSTYRITPSLSRVPYFEIFWQRHSKERPCLWLFSCSKLWPKFKQQELWCVSTARLRFRDRLRDRLRCK